MVISAWMLIAAIASTGCYSAASEMDSRIALFGSPRNGNATGEGSAVGEHVGTQMSVVNTSFEWAYMIGTEAEAPD